MGMGERLGPCNAKIILNTWFPFVSCNSLVPDFDPYPKYLIQLRLCNGFTLIANTISRAALAG